MRKSWWSLGAWTLSVIGCLASVACSPALDWRTVRPEHAPALQAVFPCKPKQVDRALAWPALPGPPVTLHLVSCKVGESIWALSYFDAKDITRVPLGLAADQRALRDNLEAVSRLGSSSSTETTVSAVDLGPTQVAGMTPNPLSRHWRLVGRRPAGQGQSAPVEVHAWHFSHGLMVYQASLWRPVPPANAKESTDAVETFIQGFKFSD